MSTPDLVSFEEIKGSATASAVAAGGSAYVEISLASDKILLGVPEVDTSTANARVEVVNGGKNKFVVKAYNDGASAQDVVIEYKAYTVRNV